MGRNDHFGDYLEEKIVCKKCGKQYLQWEENQIPGFRSRDEDVCPYCGNINGTSMDVEFHNEKIEQ